MSMGNTSNNLSISLNNSEEGSTLRVDAASNWVGSPPAACSRFYHAFIVPNYKEDISVLRDTLRQIARHPHSSTRFLLFLAMEAHEPNSSEKAQLLIDSFRPCFLAIQHTTHTMRPHEQKGKAANVSWCA